MNFKSKITVGIATGSLMLGTLATSAFAGTNADISGNGSRSDNNIRYNQENRTDINQHNNAVIDNNINSYSNTGNNRANRNVGGGTGIETGDANNSVSVWNNANMNYANVDKSHEDNSNWDKSKDNNQNGYQHGRDNGMNHMMKLATMLTGKNEVPGPGDEDGKGKVWLSFDQEKDEVCVNMHVKNIKTATMAHIHAGEKSVAGPVVVTLPTPDENGNVDECVSVSDDLAKDIQENPEDYYVNVHNDDFPNGAIRGQLSMMMN